MPNTMHSFDSSSSTVPAFLVKLWKLVEDPTCDDLIAWSDSGYSFVIKDQARFAKELLPQYFKHNNMASFIRQLNMYGFKKVMNIEKSGLRNEIDEMEFQNGFFMKEKAELLELIKRKIPNTRVVSEPPAKENAKEILIDLTTIREKQENMDNMLVKMKKENELLWRELTSMRQKHKAQEQIIQKVIQFLVSIVQRSNQNIGVQRKITRMLHNSPVSKASSSQVSRTIDVLRKNNNDCIIVPEGIVSPLGPVIHEVTDGDQEEAQTPTSQFLNSPDNQVESPETVVQSPEATVNSPLSILEALTPRTPNAADVDESILGIPLDYITVASNNDNMNVISIPENGTICNVISMPDGSNVISIPDSSSNVISIPEGNSNVISIPESSSNVISIPDDGSNVISIPEVGSSISNINSVSSNSAVSKTIPVNKGAENAGDKNISNADIVSDISHMDYLNDIASLTDLPSTSYSLSKDDFDDQLISSSLNTPKVIVSDEDEGSPKEKARRKSGPLTPKRAVSHNEHNYQLATSDSTVAKNVLSNHLLSVDEKLNYTQDRLSSNPWNMDVQSLLGLFSTDEILNCDAFTNQLPDDITIKTEPNDIVGNELVQFIPNMMDIGDTQLFEALSNDAEVPSEDQSYDFKYQPESLLQEVLNETAASQAIGAADTPEATDFLNSTVLDKSVKRKKEQTPRSKRRKAK